MASYKVKFVKELLEENGWNYIRTKGSHSIYRKEGHVSIVIPGCDNDELRIGTYKSIIRQANLK